MRELAQEDLEMLRHACLEYLAERSLLAFCTEAMARFLEKKQLVDFHVTPRLVEEACEYLLGLGLLSKQPEQFGATLYYKATTKGIQEYERSGRTVLPNE
jgi:hypothetical protein